MNGPLAEIKFTVHISLPKQPINQFKTVQNQQQLTVLIYRMIHRVLSTFKLVQGHLNGIFLTGNFAWGFSRHFVNRGQKDRAKFPNFDPCTVFGKTLRVSGGVYLPAFWATPPYYSIICFLGHTTYYYYEEQCLHNWLQFECQVRIVASNNKGQQTLT